MSISKTGPVRVSTEIINVLKAMRVSHKQKIIKDGVFFIFSQYSRSNNCAL